MLRRYVSTDSLAKLGVAYRESTDLITHYHDAFHFELRRAAHGPVSRHKLQGGVEALEPDRLRDRIQKPLGMPRKTRLFSPNAMKHHKEQIEGCWVILGQHSPGPIEAFLRK